MLSHQVKLNPPTRCSQRISHAAGVFHINHVYIDGTKIVANANKYSWGLAIKKHQFFNFIKNIFFAPIYLI